MLSSACQGFRVAPLMGRPDTVLPPRLVALQQQKPIECSAAERADQLNPPASGLRHPERELKHADHANSRDQNGAERCAQQQNASDHAGDDLNLDCCCASLPGCWTVHDTIKLIVRNDRSRLVEVANALFCAGRRAEDAEVVTSAPHCGHGGERPKRLRDLLLALPRPLTTALGILACAVSYGQWTHVP